MYCPCDDDDINYVTHFIYFARTYAFHRGIIRYAHGDEYQGTFYHGFIYGFGKYTYADGGYYEGEFRRSKRNPLTDVEFPDPDGKRHGNRLLFFFYYEE